MNGEIAAENLSVIRTLMERSALYRRALAPIMLLAGALGLAAAVAGVSLEIKSQRGFAMLWISVAGVGLLGAVAIARKQALKEGEAFWSPPARRVTGAICPGVLLGSALGVISISANTHASILLPVAWIAFYGCALHAAGYFTTSGLRKFSWFFTLPAAAFIVGGHWLPPLFDYGDPHLVMGIWFGGLQFAYGLYLRSTEKRNRPA